MGEPINYVSGNRLVRLCCKGCIKTFRKDPTKFTAKIDAVLKAKEQGGHAEGTHKRGEAHGEPHEGHEKKPDDEEHHDAHSGHKH